ncbi:MAG: hypothetical protein ACYDCK_03910 [Thermoplasmatota archaeon]
MSPDTIREARETLPLDYGYKFVTERGRRVLLVRSPKPKPDYLHELAEVALYVTLDEIKDAKDVVLIGTEKSVRLEPLLLRDHIREQKTEDAEMYDEFVRRLSREFGWTTVISPLNRSHTALAIRIPHRSVSEIAADDVKKIREVLLPVFPTRVAQCQLAYIVADADYERLGRRVFTALVNPEAPPAPQTAPTGETATDATAAFRAASVAAGVADAAVATPPAAAPAPPPLPLAVAQAPHVSGLAAFAAAAAALSPHPASKPDVVTVKSDDHNEVYVRAPPPAATPAATSGSSVAAVETVAPGAHTVGARAFERTVATEEFEVFVSKPKGAPIDAPLAAPAPAPVTPPAPEPTAASGTTPIVTPASPPLVSPVVGPASDNGAHVEPTFVAAVDEIGTLRAKFAEFGYEIMENVEVAGQTFDLAAHRDGGKRVLVKRMPAIDAATQEQIGKVTADLGADVCLVVTKEVARGARLATFGGRVEILSPDEAARLTL